MYVQYNILEHLCQYFLERIFENIFTLTNREKRPTRRERFRRVLSRLFATNRTQGDTRRNRACFLCCESLVVNSCFRRLDDFFDPPFMAVFNVRKFIIGG